MILCNVSKDKSPSIQYYFAKYPCFVFCLPCHIRRGKPAEQIAPSSFVMQRDEIIQDSKCAPHTILPDMDIREAGKVQKAEEAAPRTGQPLADIITIS